MNQFVLFGKLTAIQGQRHQLLKILKKASEEMVKLEECEIYSVSFTEKEPDAVFVYEVWENEAAHQASLQLDITQKMIQQARPVIAKMERLYTLES
ncbi:putative quinol monooxygenase [Jeotgalibacillus aurantiacus]|uniref:putative quinol monooxygenase n=1 Tax=Jeotgalibacillus aurantiacus TaxID=2763266 RepID=UPI001D09DD67|nr:antibiotic biosynthesis monooxygenase [Jeotgalibacillus aurantiacus]